MALASVPGGAPGCGNAETGHPARPRLSHSSAARGAAVEVGWPCGSPDGPMAAARPLHYRSAADRGVRPYCPALRHAAMSDGTAIVDPKERAAVTVGLRP